MSLPLYLPSEEQTNPREVYILVSKKPLENSQNEFRDKIGELIAELEPQGKRLSAVCICGRPNLPDIRELCSKRGIPCFQNFPIRKVASEILDGRYVRHSTFAILIYKRNYFPSDVRGDLKFTYGIETTQRDF